MENKITKTNEILRFVITGLICAGADFLVGFAITSLLKNKLNSTLINVIAQTLGFAVGVVINYVLSTFWVFKGVKDESKVKTTKFIIVFILLSAVAWVLSAGTFILFDLIFKSTLSIDITQQSLVTLFTFKFWGDVAFWLYFLAFCIKTIVGLIWNYFTRKYILYKNDNK